MRTKHIRKEQILDTITQVQLAIRNTGVYPDDHPATTEILHNSYQALVDHLDRKSVLTLGAVGGKVLVDDTPIETPSSAAMNLALDLEQRAIESITFCRGLSFGDYLIFIKAMTQKPKSKKEPVDVASILRGNGVATIRLNGIRYKKVSSEEEEEGHDGGMNTGGVGDGYGATAITDLDRAPEDGPDSGDTALDAAGKPGQGNPEDAPGPGESSLSAAKGSDVPENGQSPGYAKKVQGYIENLLSGRKDDELAALIEDVSRKMDDKSAEIRGKVAESLKEITTVLDEFDALKENFQKVSATLINWVKNENHVDTYLAVTKSLQNICSQQPQGRLDSYLVGETIGGRLVESNELSRNGLQEALKARKKNGNSLQYNIAALNLVNETILTRYLAQQHKNCRVVVLSAMDHIEEGVLKTIPEKYIRRYQVLPFRSEAGSLYTATINPDDWQLLKDIRFISGYPIVPHLAAEYYLLGAIEKFYHITTNKSANHQAMSKMQQEDWNSDLELVDEKQEVTSFTEELKDSDAPIIKLANVIIEEAIKQKASDIHIEPYENELRVRLRIDGTLVTVLDPSKSYASGLASRIKIMSGLDISERRLPQDGRFKVRKDGKVVDFRVSIFPGIYGEKIVLRLLDNTALLLDINQLGMTENDLTILLSAMYKSKGMILVTGPTGSGKTTTIYSMLHGLNDGTLNISTAEDPIEYNLKGINQFQMNTKIGLNFARALRTFLRQDPDIIMVGEIRDYETAEIAFKAALTGHLVLSTLHTNSAPETITRLRDIGVEPYVIATSLILVVAQRLIRKICPKCRIDCTATDLQMNALKNYGFESNGHRYHRGEGCDECGNTGYKGRMAIYEVLPMCEEVQTAILRGNSAGEIKAAAFDHGYTSLQTQGFGKVTAGITSLNEWMRVLA